MNYEAIITQLAPNVDYRSSMGLNRFLPTWGEAEFNALQWSSPVAITWADVLAAPDPDALDNAIAGIYAPVTIDGKDYPADLQSLAKYEVAKQAKGRNALTKGIAVAVDGTVTKLSTPAEIDAFHAAIEAAVTARIEAVHDAL